MEARPEGIGFAKAGIDKNLARRARKLRALPQDDFDHAIPEGRGYGHVAPQFGRMCERQWPRSLGMGLGGPGDRGRALLVGEHGPTLPPRCGGLHYLFV
jgi:hypothetical protein